MRLLPIISLLTATAAIADPAPASPDFVAGVPAHGVDRSLAASSGSSPIEPWDDIGFALDSATLVDAARGQLERTASWLLDHPAYRIVVEGHTDSSGPWDYNLDLATRRAEHARRYLVSRGVAEDRIVEAVFGASDAKPRPSLLDRRVVLWASLQPRELLAVAAIDHRSAVLVAWSDRGTHFEEMRMLPRRLAPTAIARR